MTLTTNKKFIIALGIIFVCFMAFMAIISYYNNQQQDHMTYCNNWSASLNARQTLLQSQWYPNPESLAQLQSDKVHFADTCNF